MTEELEYPLPLVSSRDTLSGIFRIEISHGTWVDSHSLFEDELAGVTLDERCQSLRANSNHYLQHHFHFEDVTSTRILHALDFIKVTKGHYASNHTNMAHLLLASAYPEFIIKAHWILRDLIKLMHCESPPDDQFIPYYSETRPCLMALRDIFGSPFTYEMSLPLQTALFRKFKHVSDIEQVRLLHDSCLAQASSIGEQWKSLSSLADDLNVRDIVMPICGLFFLGGNNLVSKIDGMIRRATDNAIQVISDTSTTDTPPYVLPYVYIDHHPPPWWDRWDMKFHKFQKDYQARQRNLKPQPLYRMLLTSPVFWSLAISVPFTVVSTWICEPPEEPPMYDSNFHSTLSGFFQTFSGWWALVAPIFLGSGINTNYPRLFWILSTFGIFSLLASTAVYPYNPRANIPLMSAATIAITLATLLLLDGARSTIEEKQVEIDDLRNRR